MDLLSVREIENYQILNQKKDKSQTVINYRVFYEKKGLLKYVGHLDLLRMVYRLVRASRLPVTYSCGFSPHPRVAFCPPLPLMVEGENEFFDLSLYENVPENQVFKSLIRLNSTDFSFHNIQLVERTTPLQQHFTQEKIEIVFPTIFTKTSQLLLKLTKMQ